MPEWFQFDLEFRVTGFNFVATVGQFTQTMTSTSSNFTSEMRQIITDMRSGSSLVFSDIQAVGPDGAARDIGSLVIRIR